MINKDCIYNIIDILVGPIINFENEYLRKYYSYSIMPKTNTCKCKVCKVGRFDLCLLTDMLIKIESNLYYPKNVDHTLNNDDAKFNYEYFKNVRKYQFTDIPFTSIKCDCSYYIINICNIISSSRVFYRYVSKNIINPNFNNILGFHYHIDNFNKHIHLIYNNHNIITTINVPIHKININSYGVFNERVCFTIEYFDMNILFNRSVVLNYSATHTRLLHISDYEVPDENIESDFSDSESDSDYEVPDENIELDFSESDYEVPDENIESDYDYL